MKKGNINYGYVRIKMVGANLINTLNQCCKNGIEIKNIDFTDELECRFILSVQKLASLRVIAEKNGDIVYVYQHSGIKKALVKLNRHKLLCAQLLILMVLFLYLPGRILFIRLEGCSNLQETAVLSCVREIGLVPGMHRRDVRSEKIKNAVVNRFPEIRWAGINTKGSVATLTVECGDAPKETAENNFGDILAVIDGVVDSVTVEKGTANCKAGDYVTKGSVLITGSADMGKLTLIQSAAGEVYGKTQHHLQLTSPVKYQKIRAGNKKAIKTRLVFEKREIKIFDNSGILGTNCGRISKDYRIRIPGGYYLPLVFRVDIYNAYDLIDTELRESEAESYMKDFGTALIMDEMISGEIISGFGQLFCGDEKYQLELDFSCREMIGRRYIREGGEQNGQGD